MLKNYSTAFGTFSLVQHFWEFEALLNKVSFFYCKTISRVTLLKSVSRLFAIITTLTKLLVYEVISQSGSLHPACVFPSLPAFFRFKHTHAFAVKWPSLCLSQSLLVHLSAVCLSLTYQTFLPAGSHCVWMVCVWISPRSVSIFSRFLSLFLP